MQHMISQPVKLGGCGLRSLAELRHAAFVGGVEMSLPHMVGGEDEAACLSPVLEEVIGQVQGGRRWADFLAAGSRTALEFQSSWQVLTTEASNIWQYLEEGEIGPLAARVEDAGGLRTDGSTRGSVVQQLEGLRHKLLSKALGDHLDREARPVTYFKMWLMISALGHGFWQLPPPTLASQHLFSRRRSQHTLLCLHLLSVMVAGLGKALAGEETK